MLTNTMGYPLGMTPNQDLTKVKGIESVKVFPTTPNSRVAVFDSDEDVFYIIQTDAGNFKTIRRFRFNEEPIEAVNDAKYVSKDEFNSLKEMIEDVQHSIQQLTRNSGKPNKQHANGSRENETSDRSV